MVGLERETRQVGTVVLVNHAPLTTRVLAQEVLRYLDAMLEVQQIITEMRGGTFVEPTIRELSHNSPLSVSFTGTIGEAVTTIQNIVIPWRRKHAKAIADLEVAEREVSIAKTQAEIQEIKVQTAQAESDPELAQIARERGRAEVERMQLENERLCG
jgi:hypothetical protein